MRRTSSTCALTRFSVSHCTETARNRFGRMDRFKVIDVAVGANQWYTVRHRIGWPLSHVIVYRRSRVCDAEANSDCPERR